MAKAGGDSIRNKRTARNADLAAERAKVTANDQPQPAERVATSPGAAATWLSWQKGQPSLNPWSSPTFLADVWCLASDDVVVVPLLPALPSPSQIGRLRKACGLTVDRVAERAQVSAEQWEHFENGDESVRQHINENQLLRFASAMAVCVAAGGPPVVGEPDPIPPAQPYKVFGAELLAELEREAGERMPLYAVVTDDRLSTAIARGEIASPTLGDWPTEREAFELVAAFPGLANRRRTVPWTLSSQLADLLERTDLTDQPFIPRDELGVGRAGMLRLLGTMAAIVEADPERAALIGLFGFQRGVMVASSDQLGRPA